MTRRRLYGLAVCLAAAVSGVVVFQSQQIPAQVGETKSKEKVAPGHGQRAKDFLAAFNKGDAKAVAAFWTTTGEYIDQTGRKHQGRAELEKLYAKAFAVNKGAKLTLTVTSARMVGSEVALEEGITEITPADGGPPSVAAFSAVLVKKDGEWYFESVRDSVAHPPTNATHFEGIEWLLGDWTGEAKKGESGRASYHWAENRNFIVSTFDTTLNGVAVIGGTQWIGWDAIDKQIRSWTFYSGGGFGEAVWSKDGAKWNVKITARSADGKKITATNVFTKTDNDHFTMQMTKLVVDGKSLPDPAPLKMVRVKAEK